MNKYKYLESYLHNHQIGVLIEIELDSEMTSRVSVVRVLAKNLAMHIAALEPENRDDLLTQRFVKEPDKKVSKMVEEVSEIVGEKIHISRFIRWSIDEEQQIEDDPPPRDPANVVRLNPVSR